MRLTHTILIVAVAATLGSQSFAGNDGFGLGVIIGEPTGPCFKLWTGARTAVDGAVAWSLDNNSNLHLHLDYLVHDFSLIKINRGRLPVYYGFGGRIRFREKGRDDNFGIRVPVGIDYLPKGSRIDVFFEVVPVLDLVPDTDITFNAAIGVRLFFGKRAGNN